MIEIKAEELGNYVITGKFAVPAGIKKDEDSKDTAKKVTLQFVLNQQPVESILYDGFRTRRIAWRNKSRAKFESIVDNSVITVAYVTTGKREVLDSVDKCANAAQGMTDAERADLIAKLEAMQPKK